MLQKDYYKKIRSAGDHGKVFKKIEDETCSQITLPDKGGGYELKFNASSYFQMAFARLIAIDNLVKGAKGQSI